MRLFRRKIKAKFHPTTESGMLDKMHKVVFAFSFDNHDYFYFDDQFKLPAGRGLCALAIYAEFDMRVDREYLIAHHRATEMILNTNPIKLTALAQINQNIRERLDMAMFPDHIYKLASVVFFDETESPYNYDYAYNLKKIEKWKASGGMLDFFLRTPLKDLIPSLQLPEQNAESFFQVANQIDELHRKNLQEVLSKKE